MNFGGPTKSVLIIRSSCYQDVMICVMYSTTANHASKPRKIVLVKENFVIKVFFLARFYCTNVCMAEPLKSAISKQL